MKTSIFRILGLSFAVFVSLFSGCTEYNLVDGPDPIRKHDTTMWEYFQSDPYNWSLTMKLIDRAGLRDVFEGKSSFGNQITFFGVTNFSIERYILIRQKDYGDISYTLDSLTPEECRDIILSCVVPQKTVLLDEWTPGRASSDPDNLIGTGGQKTMMANGKELWIYTYRSPYNGVIEMGSKQIHLVSETTGHSALVASHNIVTNTGVVHALEYNFTIFDF